MLLHKRFYTETLLHTNTFIHKHVYTQTLLHTTPFTHKHFYTQPFYTETLSHTDAFTHPFARKHFYTQTLLHTDAFTQRDFYTETQKIGLQMYLYAKEKEMLQMISRKKIEMICEDSKLKPDEVHRKSFICKHFYTHTLLLYAHTHMLLYTNAFTNGHAHRRAPLYDKQTHAHSDRLIRSLWPLPSCLGMPLPTFATACVMLIQPLKSATDEAINGFILLASFQKIALCTSKSQTDPIDLFCTISCLHTANW